MEYSIQKLETDEEWTEVSKLAKEIWTEHYTSLIGPAQTEYMISVFQSAERIKKDINENEYSYFAVYDKGSQKQIGYLALRPEEAGVFISKIYVLKAYRQKGIATEMIKYSLNFAKEKIQSKKTGSDSGRDDNLYLRLTVNKGNSGSIEFYKKVGFEISEESVTDIGNGYYMNDYVMT